VKERGTLQTKS